MKTPQRAINPSPDSAALLGFLNDNERQKMRLECEVRRYAKGEQIVREMERDGNMYFIDRGEVRVTLFSREGREVSFINLAAGGNFGEISAIDGKPRSANVIALSETDITIMPPRVFRRMLAEHPAMATRLLQQLAAMIRRLCERIFEYATIGVNNRIHAELLRLACANIDLDGIARIKNPPTHAQIASRVSCHREAVSRELKRLQNEGVLARKNRKLVVLKVQLLRDMVAHVRGQG